MTKPIDNGWQSSFLLHGIGYSLLVLALFDIIDIFVPLHFLAPTWEFNVIGSLVEHVAVPLLGLGLVFYKEINFRAKWERPLLFFLSWASLIVGVLFFLLIPLLVVDNGRLANEINYQDNPQVTQQLSQLQQLENQLGKATTAEDIDSVIARFNLQVSPPNIQNTQELKNLILSKITQAKTTIRLQNSAAMADKRLALLKKFTKWLLGSLVSGVVFIYIWHITRWARQGGKRK